MAARRRRYLALSLGLATAASTAAFGVGPRPAHAGHDCGLPHTSPLWIEFGQGSVPPEVRAVFARPGVVVAPMGWWNADYAEGRSSQATTPQRLTALGAAPTFNDNRVEVESA